MFVRPVFVLLIFLAATSSGGASAESRTVEDVEGRETSLAVLELAMKHPSGRFCGAERASLKARVDRKGKVATKVTDQAEVTEDRVLQVARKLSGNRSVSVLHCDGGDEDMIVTTTSVTHVIWKGKHLWSATKVEAGESLPSQKPSDAAARTDDEINAALAAAATEINGSLPMLVDKGLRLDRVVGKNKTFIYTYTLLDYPASAVNPEEFREGMRPRILSAVCDDEAMELFFESGVPVSYRYRGKGGKEIATITIVPSDCQ